MSNTPLLGIPQVAPNQAAKETTINDGFSIIERSLNDMRTVDLTAGPVTISQTDYTTYMLLKCSGHTAAVALTVPASKRLFMIYNGGQGVVTVTPNGTSGTTQAVPVGSYCVLFNDGTNILKLADSAASGTVTAFLALPDAPKSYAGEHGKALVVKADESGMTFGTIAVAFKDLTDVPQSYASAAGQSLRVKTDASGLEFFTPAATAQAFENLTDVPHTFAGHGGQVLMVNATENGVVFQEIDTSSKQLLTLTGTNLDFELQKNGWTQTGGNFQVVASYADMVPQSGTAFLLSNGPDLTDQFFQQTIDLTTIATTSQLDAGGTLKITGYTRAKTGGTDTGSIAFTFLAADGTTTLGQFSTGLVTNSGSWLARSISGLVPTGARKVVVTLTAHDVDGSGSVFAFDNLGGTLSIPVASYDAFVKLTDVPSSYTGAAGKAVLVNPQANGLVFGDIATSFKQLSDGIEYTSADGGKVIGIKADGSTLALFSLPTVPTHLTDLGDFPNNYTGAGSRFVKVKADATGVQFATAGLADLSDVDESTAPIAGQVLKFNGTKWAPGGDLVGSGSSTAHTYWRINITANGTSGAPTLATLEFHTKVGGTQAATGGTAIASGTDGTGDTAANAFDTDGSTKWMGNTPNTGWLGYQFPAPVTVAEVAITNRSDFSYYDAAPHAFDVQSSDDGTTWTTVWSVTAAPWSAQAMTQTFTNPSAVASTLSAMSDVDESTPPTDGQFLCYSGTAQKWKPKSATFTLAGLTDVDETTGPTDGQALVWSSSAGKWKPGTIASGSGSGGSSGSTGPSDTPFALAASIVKPTLATFASILKNGTGTAAAATTRGVYLNQTTATNNTQVAAVSPILAAPYTVTAWGRFIGIPGAYCGWGIGHFDASNSKNTQMLIGSSSTGGNRFDQNDCSALGTYAADTSLFVAASTPDVSQPVWLKVQDDGTNFIYWFSQDGEHWAKLSTRSRTAYLTPTQVGILLNVFQPSLASEVGLHVFSFSATAGLN